jgi:predicted dehydrogenase
MKIGISGLGYWGHKVVKEYMGLYEEGRLEELYIYDTVENNYEAYKTKKYIKTVNSFEDLVSMVDGIHICSPNDKHFAQIKYALEKGKSVLAEKPLTENSDEAFKCVEISLAHGCIFQVGNIFRFSNVITYTKKLIDDRAFGIVNHVSLHWSHMAPSESSKKIDVVWDLMPHILDIMNFVFNAWPSTFLYSKSNNTNKNISQRQADIILIYELGFHCNVTLSLIDYVKHRNIEISCSNGTILINPVEQKLKIISKDGVENVVIEPNNTLRDEILNFLISIQTKKNQTNSALLGALIVREIENITSVVKHE